MHAQVAIYQNLMSGRPPIQGFEDFDAFFDMEAPLTRPGVRVENFKFFDRFAEAYPNALFLLNTREKRSWLRSRALHSNGGYLKKTVNRTRKSEGEVLQIWSEEYDWHLNRVKNYFSSQPERLLVFDSDNDDVSNIIEFAAPHFELSSDHWKHIRVTSVVAEKKKWDAKLPAALV